MYQKVGKVAYKADLSNIQLLDDHLENPHSTFKTIHVGGTNGKGSTSHMIASILQEAGYKVGLYTSPHLKDFRERIRINGKMVSKQFVIGFVKRNWDFFECHPLSFFEMTVGMAFNYFAKQRVDIAIIEVGLGGRLDSTNIITPEVSVITNIGYDHTAYLGNTLKAIATEKAGIIKRNIPVVISELQKETISVFEEKANKTNSLMVLASNSVDRNYETDLLGSYQQKNSKAAVATIHQLQQKGYKISEKQIKQGLLNVVKNTKLQGRWQILQKNPTVICDTAHNKEGLSLVLDQLREQPYNHLHIVLGVVKDKNLNKILPLFPKEAQYYFCAARIPRALDVNKLYKEARNIGLNGNKYPSVEEAYLAAKTAVKDNDLIFIGGSTFVVAEIL
ncbi:folylpolyglutamate synthase/dihydrofolate synthase family protein [Spongiivirga sp. MCCC 1A20706]|uniref:bifunctional folylpolyglutamate synthase/dihydrofolate synthase n=1 Tax=Spongiivirga sp. MCCC 1A20706 TaxID=3160963 RepID=UPI003977D90A